VMAAVSGVAASSRLRGRAVNGLAVLVVEAAGVISGRLGYRASRRSS